MRPPLYLLRTTLDPSSRVVLLKKQKCYYSTPTAAGAAKGPFISTHDIPASHTGHIRVLTLSSPHNRNAISRQLLSELGSEVSRVRRENSRTGTPRMTDGPAPEQRRTRVLILASALDQAFCAGADLKERNRMSQAE